MPARFVSSVETGLAPNDMLRFEPSSARRRFGVAQALARPGFMTLRCVRRDGRLVDFAWEFASTAVARLLCAGHADLRGKLLSDVFGDQPGHALVFARYRHVVENGTGDTFEQAHHLDGVEDLCRHVAMRLGDGVAVTLVNRDAIGRARALEREVRTWPTAYRAAAVA